jgi:hypothetical protein
MADITCATETLAANADGIALLTPLVDSVVDIANCGITEIESAAAEDC